jgi:hypothetical protein
MSRLVVASQHEKSGEIVAFSLQKSFVDSARSPILSPCDFFHILLAA